MLRYINRFFKYRYLRFRIRITKKTKFSTTELSTIQRSTLEIITSLLRKLDAEILYAPVSDKFYIKMDHIFVSVQSSSNGCIVNISGKDTEKNGTYHYDIWFNENFHSRIKSRFLKSIDKRRINVEKEIIDRDTQSLNQILLDIKNNQI